MADPRKSEEKEKRREGEEEITGENSSFILHPSSFAPRWYQGVPRYAWLVLFVSALGWLFDSMDQNLFNLVRNSALTSLLFGTAPSTVLTKAQQALVTQNSANMTAIFLLGWAAGGFIFGVLGDRMGRTRTMIATILIYSIFTGLSSLTHTVPMFGLFRFLTGLGIGGEWAAGAALVSEVFPSRSRPMALGLLQALSAVGNGFAALINLTLNSVHISGEAWRWAFAVGALPALLVLWIRRSIKEPEKWQEAKDAARQTGGQELGGIPNLFRDPVIRRNTIAATLMATAGVGGLWGIAFWTPELTKVALAPLNLPKQTLAQYQSYVFLTQQAGAFCGMYAYATLAERYTRRGVLSMFFYLAFAAIQLTFWQAHNMTSLLILVPIMGFCTLGPFAAYTVFFPELFPTRLRATGCGFAYNCARVLAALAPFTLGKLAQHFADAARPDYGFRMAASIVAFIYLVGFVGLALAPETKGKPLPE